MAFKVTEQETQVRSVIADERLWLTEDGQVVSDGDPAAFELLAAPGQQIPRDQALALGLVKPAKDEKPAVEAAGVVEEGATVQEILDTVGDDPAKAQAALDAEQASPTPRKSLVSKLEKIAGAE